jgi:hypothetical protein
MSKRLLFASIVVLLTASPLSAGQILSLYNTGVGNSGAPLLDGSVDPHYSLVVSPDASAPGPNTYVVNTTGYPIPSSWIQNDSISKWIGPQADESIGNSKGDYTYRTTFDLSGFDPQTAVITGRLTADDSVQRVLINGTLTGISYIVPASFTMFSSPFTIGSGFKSGENTLDFVVENTFGLTTSPTGLRVEMTGTASPTPEPSTIIPAATAAVMGLGYWMFKCRRTAA